MDKIITAEKVVRPEVAPVQPTIVPEALEVYTVFTEETRTDEAGNEYQYTRKEVFSTEQIDREVAAQDRVIEAANKRKDELLAKRGVISNVKSQLASTTNIGIK